MDNYGVTWFAIALLATIAGLTKSAYATYDDSAEGAGIEHRPLMTQALGKASSPPRPPSLQFQRDCPKLGGKWSAEFRACLIHSPKRPPLPWTQDKKGR